MFAALVTTLAILIVVVVFGGLIVYSNMSERGKRQNRIDFDI